MADKNIKMARRIAGAVRDAGGRTFFVGGFVRDRLLGRDNKDIDIEIHGIPVQTLAAVLDGLGERTEMGASFGVMGLRHYEIDIAMPRSERATGRGHKDFEVFVDPFIGYEKAARRRDFTMNALMEDVLTGEVLDYFGGREDMANGLIRHVNDATFVEDPLRVFRAARFAARFGFRVAEETAALSAGMAVDALARERVMGELEKALLKAPRPSVFFAELRRMRQLGLWFAELKALPEAQWRRATQSLDAAAALRGRAEEPLDFMMAALCLGLEDAAAERLLARLTNEVRTTRYALNMARQCRAAAGFLEADPGEEAWMALYDGAASPAELPLLVRALVPEAAGLDLTGLEAMLALYRERMEKPALMGRDLVQAGVCPGPAMGEALAYAHRLHLTGVPKEVQLQKVMERLKE